MIAAVSSSIDHTLTSLNWTEFGNAISLRIVTLKDVIIRTALQSIR